MRAKLEHAIKMAQRSSAGSKASRGGGPFAQDRPERPFVAGPMKGGLRQKAVEGATGALHARSDRS